MESRLSHPPGCGGISQAVPIRPKGPQASGPVAVPGELSPFSGGPPLGRAHSGAAASAVSHHPAGGPAPAGRGGAVAGGGPAGRLRLRP